MMVRRAARERGHANHGWLDSWHTFSFADYYDPKHMGFRVLRVINEDFIEGGKGFGMHGHRDMEIVTYVVSGELAHKDTLGNAATIKPGEVQRMSAGTGIRHSEFNQLSDQQTHLLQIWLLPRAEGLPSGYEQKDFSKLLAQPGLHKVVSSMSDMNSESSAAGGESTIGIQQDVDIYVGKLENSSTEFRLRSGRHAWVQMVKGDVAVGSGSGRGPSGQLGGSSSDIILGAGDGLAVSEESSLTLSSKGSAEFLLFDLP